MIGAGAIQGVNPLKLIAGAFWKMIVNILGMVGLTPLSFAAIVGVALGVAFGFQIYGAVRGTSKWSVHDGDGVG